MTPQAPPLRVAQLITTLARGGAQATLLASRDMADHGATVTILAGLDDPGEGTYWCDLETPDDRVVEVPILHRALHPVADIRTLYWLVRWLRSTRPDVLHTHSSKAGALGRLAAAISRVPVVHTVHGWSFAAPGRKGRLERVVAKAVIALERALAHLSGALIVVTPLDIEQGLANGIGRPDQYRLVRSGVELDRPRAARHKRQELREQLGLDDSFVVGTVGRLAAQKDLGTLIEAFAIAERDGNFEQEAVLAIVGDGPDRHRLEAQSKSAGIGQQTIFLGQRPDAAELVAAFDAFVLTSLWEGLPRTIVEAMAASVPVIATQVGGVEEIVRDGETGFLVAPGDAAGVARAISCLRRDPGVGQRVAARAGDEVNAFSAERMRHDLGLVWSELTLGHR